MTDGDKNFVNPEWEHAEWLESFHYYWDIYETRGKKINLTNSTD